MKSRFTFALLSGFVLSACAAFPSSAAQINPQRRSLVDQTCARVMGLRPGESYFAACQDSLSNSLAGRSGPGAQPVTLAYADTPENAKPYYNVSPEMRWRREQSSCAQIGLAPGSASFTHCVTGLDADLFKPFY